LRKAFVFQILWLFSLFSDVRLEIFQGSEIIPFAEELAKISNVVFKEYPYLYGVEDSGEFYITRFGHSQMAKLCVAYEDTRVVGYIIGEPLKDYSLSFQQPFVDCGLNIDDFFYIAEVGLLPEYRGQSVGKDMLFQMEELVKQEGNYPMICLAHIDESRVLTKAPRGYRSLSYLWNKLQYEKREDLSFNTDYPNVGDIFPSMHTLVYWIKRFDHLIR
jgi:ribosomal protein S18 acetylase RimI-like enzyme